MEPEESLSLIEMLNVARVEEMQELSQFLLVEQPINDETAQFIIQNLNLALDRTKAIAAPTTNTISVQQQQPSASAAILPTQQRPYPPMHQAGLVEDHDRPYAEYGHLDRQTLVQEGQFDLQLPLNQQPIRLHAKSFAITAWTDTSKRT